MIILNQMGKLLNDIRENTVLLKHFFREVETVVTMTASCKRLNDRR